MNGHILWRRLGKFLSDTKYVVLCVTTSNVKADFTLEVYANDTPAPNILPKEVDIAQAAPFLLTNTGVRTRKQRW